MKISSVLHFTENHQFYVYRDFDLSHLDYRMLNSIYQPMIGAEAISLFLTLHQQISTDKIGYSAVDQLRKLFLLLNLDQGNQGRTKLIEQTSRLEAIGLLQTTRKLVVETDEYMYEYQLVQPLPPQEFFKTQHFTLLLRDKVGKHMVLAMKDQFITQQPLEIHEKEMHSENLSVPFYELFRLNTKVIDYELEQALLEIAPSRQAEKLSVVDDGFQYADIIMRFPKNARNRSFVENLRTSPDQVATINYVAKKYQLTLLETCRLLDEDGIFDEDGVLQIDFLQKNANQYFRQDKKRDEERERHLQHTQALHTEELEIKDDKSVEWEYYLEVPSLFQGQGDVHQYNYLLRNEPYTQIIGRFFSKGTVPDGILDILSKVDLNYKLKEEVINVLIHFMYVDKRSWAKSSIEAVASDMLGKQVQTYEQAVEYVREKIKFKENKATQSKNTASNTTSSYRGKSRSKPVIPIMTEETSRKKPLSPEEIEAIRLKALRLDGKI